MKQVKKRIVAYILTFVMAFTYTPGFTMAYAGDGDKTPATLSTNIGDQIFIAGSDEWTEFTFTTTANDDAGVMVTGGSDFGTAYEDKIAALEYKDGENWYDMKGKNFGGTYGFPMSDSTSTFRVKFTEDAVGEYSFTAAMTAVEDGSEVCTLEVPFSVVKEYNVQYSIGTGAGTAPVDSTNYPTGTKVTTASADNLSKEGAEFTGWQRSDTKEIVAAGGDFIMPAEDVTLTAQWKNVYTVTYSAGTGEGTVPETAKYSDADPVTVAAPNGLSKEGYDFAGWKRSDNGGIINEADSFNMPSLNLVLTAQWSKQGEKYSVTYTAGEGEGTEVSVNDLAGYAPVTAKADDTFIAPSGKHFVGWKRSDDGSIIGAGESFNMPSINIILTAQWDKDAAVYNVKYAKGVDTEADFTGIDNLTDVKAGDMVTVAAAPTTTSGKVFAGWRNGADQLVYQAKDSFVMPAVSVTLTAQWTDPEKTYDVKYALKGGEGTYADMADKNINDVITVSSDIPEKEGYDFVGWMRSDNGQVLGAGDAFNMPGMNVTLTAQWAEKAVVEPAVSTDIASKAFVTGEAVEFTVTTKANGLAGTPVMGWFEFSNPNAIEKLEYLESQNGQWYELPGSYFGPPNEGFTLTDATSKFRVTFKEAGTYDVKISVEKFAPGPTESTVLCSVEKKVTVAGAYTVTYAKGSGTGTVPEDTNKYKDGEEVTVLAADGLNKDNYTFAGWKRSDNGDIVNGGDTFNMPKANITLTAQWEALPSEYTITYDGNGEISGTTDAETADSSKPYAIASNGYAKTVDGIDYTFVGWCAAADGHGKYYQVGDTITVIGNMTLYAQWLDLNDYTLSYDKGTAPEGKTVAGDVPASKSGKAGAEYTVAAGTVNIPDDADNSYVMSGWNTKADGSGDFYSVGDTITLANEDVTLYAQWQAIAKTEAYIAYDPNGGNQAPVDNNNPYAKGDKAIALGAGGMSKSGFEFSGWNTEADGSGTAYVPGDAVTFEKSEKVTLYAQWKEVTTYKVTYDANGGEGAIPVDSKKYVEEELVTLSDAPNLYKEASVEAKVNYVFDGWTIGEDTTVYAPGSTYAIGTEDVTFKAHWREIPMDEFAVIYNLSGGTGEVVDNNTYIAGAKVKVVEAEPTRDGYVFDGWGYMTADGKTYKAGEEISMPEGGLYLVAQWTAVYTVTYDADGGSAVTDENKYKLGETVTVGDASNKEGYTFEGWLDKASNTEYGAGTTFPMPGKNLVLTAQWAKNYTVTFSLGEDYVGTETAPDDQTVTIGTCVTSVGTPANYTKEAVEYYFAGWYNQNGDKWDFSKPVDAGCFTADGVMTLTAKWETTQQYNVIFDDNLDAWYDEYVTVNGAADEDGQYTSSDLSFISADKKINQAYVPEYARVDYTFTGWYLDKACKAEYDLDDTLTGNHVDNRSNPVVNEDGTKTFTLYAGWEAKYDSSDDVEIYTNELKDGTYGLYFSQFMDAYDNTASNTPVYRNYVLVNADKGNTVNPTTLPEGLYLNSRTGEIYGVPTKVGEYSFTVRVRDDEGKNWISEPQTITVTINQMPFAVDHSADRGTIFDKTYGDLEEKALNMDDKAEGQTYMSRNLVVKLNKVDIEKGKDVNNNLGSLTNVSMTLSGNNQNVNMVYNYKDADADRAARAPFDPANANTLRHAKDLNDPINLAEYTINDLATVPYVREEGEDAGKYKLSVQNDDITIVTKGTESDVKPNYNDDIVADEFKVKEMAEDTAAKYVFTINAAKLTVDLPEDASYYKIYGETDTLFADKLLLSDILNAAETTTPVASGEDKTVTIEFKNGIKDTITFGYSRNTLLEDAVRDAGSAGRYKLYLTTEDITGVSINSVTSEAEDVAAKLANNYDINIVDAFQTDSIKGSAKKYIYIIKQRDAGKFTPENATVVYGTLSKDSDVAGTVRAESENEGLANNDEIKVIDEITAKVADTAANISTGNYLKAKTSYTNEDEALSFSMENTKFVEDADDNTTASNDTTANYKENTPEYTLTVTQKPITLTAAATPVVINSNGNADADTVKGLVSVSGVLTGDVVNENDIMRFTYTLNNETKNNMTAAETAAAFQAYADNATENEEITVSVTLDLTCSDAGVDAPNYSVAPVDSTIKITVIEPTPLELKGSSKSATVGKTSITADELKAMFSITGTTGTDKAAVNFANAKFTVDGTEYATAEAAVAAINTDTAKTYNIKLITTSANAFTLEGTGVYSLPVNSEAIATYKVSEAVTPGGGGGGGGGGSITPTPVLITDDHIAYMKGDGAGFNPDANMTRAEAATVFYNLLSDKNVGKAVPSFSDVQPDDWFYTAVTTLAAKGIIEGYEDGTYNPNGQITRAEFAALASRFGNLSTGTCTFSDVNVDYWAYKYIASAVTKGWITGYPDNTFRPESNIKRAEVAALVNRVLNRVPDEKYIDANISKITVPADVTSDNWAYYQIIEATNAHDYTKASETAVEAWKSLK